MNGNCPGRLIIAIDGPSGAGKSSVTKRLAERLEYLHIDTGAMFRAVAVMALRRGISPDDAVALAGLCDDLEIEFALAGGVRHVLVNGEDVTDAIRSPEISLLTSRIAAVPAVRQSLLHLQRRMGERGGVVLEGRDIGTVVFPDADLKFYLTASAEERGKRRYLELKAGGLHVSLEQTIEEVLQRDQQDLLREAAPLRMALDAIEIDSTALTPDEVVSIMERHVRAREGLLAPCI